MIVKGDLIPFFRHLQQMIAFELFPNKKRLARSGNPKIMGQFELLFVVVPDAGHLLHNLQQHPGRILGQCASGRIQDFIFQRLQCTEPSIGFADFQ